MYSLALLGGRTLGPRGLNSLGTASPTSSGETVHLLAIGLVWTKPKPGKAPAKLRSWQA